MDMEKIEALAKDYATKRDELAAAVNGCEDDIRVIKRRHLPVIKRKAAAAAAVKSVLQDAVESRPDLFKRPKTRILHGIKVGWMKQKGKITFASAERVVKLIQRHLPERFEELVKVSETPLKGPLGRLSGAELKKIGVQVGDDSDQVVVAPADSEIDKLVDALLDGAEESKEAAE